jgi:parallel beta-helix repeat protein
MKTKLSIYSFITTALMVVMVVFSQPSSAAAAGSFELQASLLQLQGILRELSELIKPQVQGVATVVVTNDAGLSTAIAGATGGETIQLAPGVYNAITINKTPASKVIITSRDANNPAIVGKITANGSNWHFNNLDVSATFPAGAHNTAYLAVTLKGSNNTFENSSVTYGNSAGWTATDWNTKAGSGVSVSGGTNNLIKNNLIKTVHFGITVDHSAKNATVINNTIDGVAGDGMRGLGDFGLFENNLILNTKQTNGNHSDCFQSWSKLNGTVGAGEVVGVVIRGNQCLPALNTTDPLTANTQGYSIFDGVARDWIVENNILFSNTFHGSSLSGGNNSVIRNNTLVGANGALPGTPNGNAVHAKVSGTKTGIAPVNSKVENNIVNNVWGMTTNANVTYTNNSSARYANYDTWFVDWRNGNMALKSGAPANGAGATPVANVGSARTITNPSGGGGTTPLDTDKDGVADTSDNCVAVANATQANFDNDTQGDACDLDDDNDSILDTAEKAGCQFDPSVTCGAVPSAPTLVLSAAPASIATGGNATLTWSSTNVTSCTASGAWSGSKAVNGSAGTGALSSVGAKTFTLSCSGTGGTVTKSVSVSVTTQAPLDTDKDGVADTSDNCVAVANATQANFDNDTQGDACDLDDDNDSVLDTAEKAGCQFNASNTCGTTTNPAAPTITMSATPNPVVSGSKSTVSWSATNANSCTGSGAWSGSKAISGSIIDTFTASETFTLTCTGAGGSASKSVTVTVKTSSDGGGDGGTSGGDTPTEEPVVTTTRVVTTDNLNVRSAPNGTRLGTQPRGSWGTKASAATVAAGGYSWAQVNFDNAPDGYVVTTYLSNTSAGGATITEDQTKAEILKLLRELERLQKLLAELQAA